MRKTIGELQFSKVYPMYVQKVERKGRTTEELDEAIRWLTGYGPKALDRLKGSDSTLERFFAEAPNLNPNRDKITGVICGIRVEEIDDTLIQQIRQLDKLVDEIARGKAMDKVLRREG